MLRYIQIFPDVPLHILTYTYISPDGFSYILRYFQIFSSVPRPILGRFRFPHMGSQVFSDISEHPGYSHKIPQLVQLG